LKTLTGVRFLLEPKRILYAQAKACMFQQSMFGFAQRKILHRYLEVVWHRYIHQLAALTRSVLQDVLVDVKPRIPPSRKHSGFNCPSPPSRASRLSRTISLASTTIFYRIPVLKRGQCQHVGPRHKKANILISMLPCSTHHRIRVHNRVYEAQPCPVPPSVAFDLLVIGLP
jgi:hypothetical protein